MNEATFEARLNAQLQNLFPSIDPKRIRHQTILNLRLGHHRIIVDGEPKTRAGGRLDILILIDEIPVLLLELKSPEVQILDEDRDQGISYARLIDKMPPLVAISNGKEIKFYTTYDKLPWHGSTISEEAIQQLLQHALACAAADRDEAVRLLLGYRPDIWTTIIKETTEVSMKDLSSRIADWSHPLSEGFSIPRRIATEIGALIAGDVQVLILTGPPLSGKTNVLHQFCKGDDHPDLIPLYIDGSLVNFGLFQYLANVFGQTLLRATPLEQIRQWLIVSLRGSPERRMVFVIDGGITAPDDRLAADINELLPMLESSNTSIVLALNDSLLPDLINVRGRTTKTPLGRKAKILKLSPLTDDEFPRALEYLARECSGKFNSGVYNSQAFRHPRLLRICAAHFMANLPNSPAIDKEVIGVLPGVPSLEILNIAWNVFVGLPQLRDDLRRLACAFIADEQNRRKSGSLALFAYNTGSMTIQMAEDVLGAERLNRLRSQGYVGFANGPSGSTLCVPNLPEALSAAAVYEVSTGFNSVMTEKGLELACEYLLEKSEPFPYGDIVGALAIVDIASRSEMLTYPILRSLIEHRPVREQMGDEANISIRSTKRGEIRMHLTDESGQSLGDIQSNSHAWLVLSHLATRPMIDSKGNWDFYLSLIAQVGSYENVLLRPDFIYVEDAKGIHVHDIGESGATVCYRGGIVEPITLAMQMGFYRIPNKMLRLCRSAAKGNNIYLAYRLLLASHSVESSTEDEVVASAIGAQELLHPVISQDIEEKCGQIVQGRQASAGRTSKERKIGRNEKCPYGSGLKYKKCCGR